MLIKEALLLLKNNKKKNGTANKVCYIYNNKDKHLVYEDNCREFTKSRERENQKLQ